MRKSNRMHDVRILVLHDLTVGLVLSLGANSGTEKQCTIGDGRCPAQQSHGPLLFLRRRQGSRGMSRRTDMPAFGIRVLCSLSSTCR